MKVYEILSSIESIKNEVDYLKRKLENQDIVMSTSEFNHEIEKIENLNNKWYEILNSDVEYSLSKQNITINYTQPTTTDATKFLNEITNILSKKGLFTTKI